MVLHKNERAQKEDVRQVKVIQVDISLLELVEASISG